MDIAYFRTQVILGGGVPTVMLLWDAQRGQLGANAVNNALHTTGILSLVFLFLSLAVTPLRVMTGWNWLIAARRSLGLYGFLYAVLHLIIYVTWDRMGSLASAMEEIVSRRFLTVGFLALLLMIPLAVTSTHAMIRKLGASRWKLLHRLAYVVVILAVMHYYMLVKSDVRQPLAFALVLTPLLGFRAVKHYVDLRASSQRAVGVNTKTEDQPRKPSFFRGELLVANIFDETADVKTFRLVNPGGGEIPFRHQPGQYMTLQLEVDSVPMRRSYTIASAPSQRSYVELTIKRHPDGVVSKYMHDHVRVGQRIRLGAPGGKFWFDGSNSSQVLLIAGGVGITPTMSMLRYLTDIGWAGKIFFLNAVRTDQDLIFLKELESLASRHSNVTLVSFLSRTNVAESRQASGSADTTREPVPWHRPGYIDARAIEELVPNVANTPVYLCGPESMMAAMRTALQQLGVNESLVFTEEFISIKSSTNGEPVAGTMEGELLASDSVSQLKFVKSDVLVEWLPEQSLLETAESHSVRINSECRSGICGQCKVRCLSGRVTMESADALTLSERQSGFVLACQAQAASGAVEIEA